MERTGTSVTIAQIGNLESAGGGEECAEQASAEIAESEEDQMHNVSPRSKAEWDAKCIMPNENDERRKTEDA